MGSLFADRWVRKILYVYSSSAAIIISQAFVSPVEIQSAKSKTTCMSSQQIALEEYMSETRILQSRPKSTLLVLKCNIFSNLMLKTQHGVAFTCYFFQTTLSPVFNRWYC